jgi:hypothetical protein
MKTRTSMALALLLAAGTLLPWSARAEAATACTFTLGFKALRDQIPQIVGDCIENEWHGSNGDALQRTTRGLLAWRKADNWTAFTDGATTWINGPQGLQSRPNDQRFPWEGQAPTPAPQPSAPAPPPPPAVNQADLGFFPIVVSNTRFQCTRDGQISNVQWSSAPRLNISRSRGETAYLWFAFYNCQINGTVTVRWTWYFGFEGSPSTGFSPDIPPGYYEHAARGMAFTPTSTTERGMWIANIRIDGELVGIYQWEVTD